MADAGESSRGETTNTGTVQIACYLAFRGLPSLQDTTSETISCSKEQEKGARRGSFDSSLRPCHGN